MKIIPITDENKNELLYCGTLPEEGMVQMEILIKEGMKKDHKCLEIGCGALCAGYPIMNYLDKNNYFAIESNINIVEASMKIAEVREVVKNKNPVFYYMRDFDFDEKINLQFDFIISHSVANHCGKDLLDNFFKLIGKSLRTNSKALVSLLIGTDGDKRGIIYPESVAYSLKTIGEITKKYNLTFEEKPEYTDLITRIHNSSIHNWLCITNN